jgi:hypothetical protein
MEITKQLAHVVLDENLFVREVERIPGRSQFTSRFTVDGRHPYLYENPAIANHVSGTTFLDVCRQLLKAVTHLYYEVPLDNRFVIRTANMDFGRWAKLGVPIEIVADLSHKTTQLRGLDCLSYEAEVRFYQEGRLTGTMTGQFSTFPQAVEDLLMGRQYRQPPLAAAPSETGACP